MKSIFTSNILLIIVIFTTQKTNKNVLFEKIGLLVSIVVEYYNILINLLYFASILLIMNVETESGLKSISKNIIKIRSIVFYLLLFAFTFLLFYPKLNMKSCFIGSCIVDKSLRLYLQIYPSKLECVAFIFLFAYWFYGQIFRNSNKSIGINNYISSVINENYSLWRVIIFEIIYFLFNTFDFAIKYYKIVFFTNFRYEDYASIHDYHLIIKSFLVFLIVGFNKNDIIKWASAFEDDTIEIEDKEAQEFLKRINEKIKGDKEQPKNLSFKGRRFNSQ
jgi:hypothetical protein